MNRDYDYPWDPSDQQYIKLPEPRKIRQYNKQMARYVTTQQARARAEAKANWQAMTPDEKRIFIQRHPEAFQPGGLLGD